LNSFAELVNEAFIKPLRSVLIVDDQYPTWEEIFNSQLNKDTKDAAQDALSLKKRWRNEAQGPFEVIKSFRKRNPGFVIDIHDAVVSASNEGEGETAAQLADHLHQSDLLVLDYNLEGASTGVGGKLARKILHSVLSNQHFNLIIVHTDEPDLQDVAETCLVSLMDICSAEYAENYLTEIQQAEEFIGDLEDSNKFDRKKFEEIFSRTHYLHCRKIGHRKAVSEYLSNSGQLAPLYQYSEQLHLTMPQKKSFLLWAINHINGQLRKEFALEALKGLVWSFNERTKWIRTSRGFVCFINKGLTNLLEQLENALIDWKPTPSRLLSAKYRYELNRIGVDAEDDALLKNHLFALFYKDIRNGGREDILEDQKEIFRDQKLREHVTRQSEGLSFLIEDNIVNFGKEIIKIDLSVEANFLAHYEVDLDKPYEVKKARAQYNHYVSTLPPKNGTSEQLDSGHIFKVDDQWWVCATPACDLQPGQKSIAFGGNSSSLRPFTAFQLIKKLPENLTSAQINGGSYCFIEDNGEIIALNIKSIEDEQQPSNLKVHWQTFVAESGGVIQNNRLNIKRFIMNDDNVSTEQKEALVICKLRYPYALNYIQRVGISASRIGLEYVS
jgi:CheY-like chemotaxis protein